MELLYIHQQEKTTKKTKSAHGLDSDCVLKLFSDDNSLVFMSVFNTEYRRLNNINKLQISHGLTIHKATGDFNVFYQVNNSTDNKNVLYKNSYKTSKNNFDLLLDLSQRGLYSKEGFRYWGAKYRKAALEICKLISIDLNMATLTPEKESVLNPLYDMLVDYHIGNKKIKAHDSIYWDIRYAYPKKKWLKLNDNKFIPAVLDQYGIKSNYLIGKLSTRTPDTEKINLNSLKFLCDIFGGNYVDYIKTFNWSDIIRHEMKYKKTFTCETENEKRSIAKALKSYSDAEQIIYTDDILTTIQNLFTLQKFLKQNGLNMRIKANNTNDLNTLHEIWNQHKKHIKTGYKLRYYIPDEMIEYVESPIELDGVIFKPKIILSEDQFKVEGMVMKNCMAKQFQMGLLFTHISLSSGKHRINVQYRKGNLNQAYGKTNTEVPDMFKPALVKLNERMLEFKHIQPKREKYDFITPL
jgi:hypothetical protein